MSSVPRERSAFVVALTGGIASGKSAVAKHFEQAGIPLFDADRVAHSLVEAGQAALQEISSAFGSDAISPSGDLDRRRMREIVFHDAQARHKLEAILHPKIHARLIEEVEGCASPYCVLAIPLFAECRQDYLWVDRILVTDVPRSVQINRLMQRPGIDAPMAERILDAQATREQRLALANDVIDNTAPIDRLSRVVSRLQELYSGLAQERSR
jgi:dephospho-CoA kinase